MTHAVGIRTDALTQRQTACFNDGTEFLIGVPLCECCDNEVDYDTQYCRSCEEVVEPLVYHLDDDGCLCSRHKYEIEAAEIELKARRDAFEREIGV